MSRLEQLRQISDNTLHDLKADDVLKFRILREAAGQINRGKNLSRFVPVVCTALAVLLICVLALNTLQPVPSAVPGEINAFAAGNTDSKPHHILSEEFDTGSVLSVDYDGLTTVTDPEQCERLAGLLLAASESAGSADDSTEGTLIFTTRDGTVYRFHAAEPYLTDGNGRQWICQALFDELSKLKK